MPIHNCTQCGERFYSPEIHLVTPPPQLCEECEEKEQNRQELLTIKKRHNDNT